MSDIPEFLKIWIDNIKANKQESLYILSFRRLLPQYFTLLFDAITDCTSLTTLSASGKVIESQSFSSLYNALTKNTSLISIDLGNNQMGNIDEDTSEDNLFSVLCKAIGQNKSIQTWNLEYKGIGLKASKVFSQYVLSTNRTLSTLLLARNNLGDEGCIELCNGIVRSKNCTLKELSLIDNGIGKKGIIEGIAKLLTWKGEEEEEEEPEKIKSSNELLEENYRNNYCNIKELDLSQNKFGEEGGVAIGEALKENYHLRKLNLSNCEIGDETLISICQGLQHNTEMNSNNAKVLGSTKSNTLDTGLPRNISQYSENGFSLQYSAKLTNLILNNNNITEKSCSALAEFLSKNPILSSISLINNSIKNEGIKTIVNEGLCTVENNTNLTNLDISRNDITFEGFKSIIQNIPKLKVIVLHHNTINYWEKDFIDSLDFNSPEFIGCSSLKELHLVKINK